MFLSQKKVFQYKENDVDNQFANYLIDLWQTGFLVIKIN